MLLTLELAMKFVMRVAMAAPCRLTRLIHASLVALVVCLCLGLLPHAQGQPAVAAEVLSDRVDYLAGDGSWWSVARSGGMFLLLGRSSGRPPFLSEVMTYRGWDQLVWSARWEGAGFGFTSTAFAGVQRGDELRYIDWQGRRMRMRWDAGAGKFRLSAPQSTGRNTSTKRPPVRTGNWNNGNGGTECSAQLPWYLSPIVLICPQAYRVTAAPRSLRRGC